MPRGALGAFWQLFSQLLGELGRITVAAPRIRELAALMKASALVFETELDERQKIAFAAIQECLSQPLWRLIKLWALTKIMRAKST